MHDHTNNVIASAVASVPSESSKVQVNRPEPKARIELERFLLGKKEMAKLYKCHTKTIERRSELGQLPKPIKSGGRLYWRRDEVFKALGGEK
jgi:predicted DNA-binding transcriptional regulator AlpA